MNLEVEVLNVAAGFNDRVLEALESATGAFCESLLYRLNIIHIDWWRQETAPNEPCRRTEQRVGRAAGFGHFCFSRAFGRAGGVS